MCGRLAMRLLYLCDGGQPSIIFPVGKPETGGSCAFATEHCLQYCPSLEPKEREREVLEYFKKEPPSAIISKILNELVQLFNSLFLYWHSWGDCLPELEDKEIKIMSALHSRGIVQCGATRNLSLWHRIPFERSLRIAYHAESQEEAVVKSQICGRLTCYPDVKRGKAQFFVNGKKVAECCGYWTQWLDGEVEEADCRRCYIYRQGCFFEANR